MVDIFCVNNYDEKEVGFNQRDKHFGLLPDYLWNLTLRYPYAILG